MVAYKSFIEWLQDDVTESEGILLVLNNFTNVPCKIQNFHIRKIPHFAIIKKTVCITVKIFAPTSYEVYGLFNSWKPFTFFVETNFLFL